MHVAKIQVARYIECSFTSRLRTTECAAQASNALLPMSDVTIKVRESGPYRVTGPITLVDADGNPHTIEGENVALCRCGGSQTKPFCDGSHKTNGFTALERATPKTEA
jgi:CDGSH-type Zn-finger protein